jgi:peptide/nickel transport system substrate-binding protein
VTLRLLPQDASRVAALLSGDVQVIENVPTSDVANLRKDKRVAIFRTVADRLIYLHLDSDRDASPFVTTRPASPREEPAQGPARAEGDLEGDQPAAIVDKVMEGEAVPAGQLVPEFLFGATKNLKVEAFDPEGAKKLLAEAGYSDGFGLTIHAPNNRYVNDAKVAQAVAQMLSRVGIDTKVVAMPSATVLHAGDGSQVQLHAAGLEHGNRRIVVVAQGLLMTFNRDKGYGTANRGRYSNSKVDALTEDALATVDDAKREAVPAARDRARDQRHGHRAAAFPGQPVGDARRNHVCAAHRREHARMEVPASGGERSAVAMRAGGCR